MIIIHRNLGLKFLLCLNGKCFDLKERYRRFSTGIGIFCKAVGKGDFFAKRDGYRQKLYSISIHFNSVFISNL